jgi:hypothetical protein
MPYPQASGALMRTQENQHIQNTTIVCTEMVFRGLSTGNWRPERVEFLRGLIHSPEEITLTSHDSATLSEEIGRDWCRIGPDDEERHLSVFLRV